MYDIGLNARNDRSLAFCLGVILPQLVYRAATRWCLAEPFSPCPQEIAHLGGQVEQVAADLANLVLELSPEASTTASDLGQAARRFVEEFEDAWEERHVTAYDDDDGAVYPQRMFQQTNLRQWRDDLVAASTNLVEALHEIHRSLFTAGVLLSRVFYANVWDDQHPEDSHFMTSELPTTLALVRAPLQSMYRELPWHLVDKLASASSSHQADDLAWELYEELGRRLSWQSTNCASPDEERRKLAYELALNDTLPRKTALTICNKLLRRLGTVSGTELELFASYQRLMQIAKQFQGDHDLPLVPRRKPGRPRKNLA